MIEIFQNIIIFLIGASLGSFLCAWIDRSAIPTGRSVCDNCQKSLKWFEMIPVLSYLVLGGKCRGCRESISFLKILAEISLGLLALAWWLEIDGLNPLALIDGLSLIILASLFFFDLKYMRLPNTLTLSLAILGLIKILVFGVSISNLIIGLVPAIIFGIMYLVSKGRWVGLGDVKLLLAIALISTNIEPWLVFISSILVGGIIGIGLILAGRAQMSSKIPFGSLLALFTILIIIFRDEISSTIIWYIL